jgi:hypothetical protein
MTNTPPRKPGDPQNINIKAGNGSVIAGHDINGPVIINQPPPQPTAAQLYKIGLDALRAGMYVESIESLEKSILQEFRHETLYTLALAQLHGKRPQLLTYPQAEQVDRLLSQACSNPNSPAHYFFLRAIIYHDFYLVKGFRDDRQPIQALLEQGFERPFLRKRYEEMLQQINASDCPVVQFLQDHLQ